MRAERLRLEGRQRLPDRVRRRHARRDARRRSRPTTSATASSRSPSAATACSTTAPRPDRRVRQRRRRPQRPGRRRDLAHRHHARRRQRTDLRLLAANVPLTGPPRPDYLRGDLSQIVGTLNLDAGSGRHTLMISDEASSPGVDALVTENRSLALTKTGHGDRRPGRPTSSPRTPRSTSSASRRGRSPSAPTPAGTFADGVWLWTGFGNDNVTIDAAHDRRSIGVRTVTFLNTGLGNDVVNATITDSEDDLLVVDTQGAYDQDVRTVTLYGGDDLRPADVVTGVTIGAPRSPGRWTANAGRVRRPLRQPGVERHRLGHRAVTPSSGSPPPTRSPRLLARHRGRRRCWPATWSPRPSTASRHGHRQRQQRRVRLPGDRTARRHRLPDHHGAVRRPPGGRHRRGHRQRFRLSPLRSSSSAARAMTRSPPAPAATSFSATAVGSLRRPRRRCDASCSATVAPTTSTDGLPAGHPAVHRRPADRRRRRHRRPATATTSPSAAARGDRIDTGPATTWCSATAAT